MDPHAVLGIPPGATPEQAAHAYRELAKRHHPDRSGDPERMREINAAYQTLRERGWQPPPAPEPQRRADGPPAPWLAPALRMALGPELLRVLLPGEPVLMVTDAATWDAHDVRLALTDRRLLWLRDDAITDRVRALRRGDVVEAEVRVPRRGRSAELRLRVREGRRLAFAELRPETAHSLARLLAPRN